MGVKVTAMKHCLRKVTNKVNTRNDFIGQYTKKKKKKKEKKKEKKQSELPQVYVLHALRK